MKKFIATIAVFLSFAASAEPFENWTDNEKKMFIASEIVLAMDWAQTRTIAQNPNQFHEKNVILGKHPSVGNVNAYFAGAMALNYFLADYLGENRMLYLSSVTVFEGAVVRRNQTLGIAMKF